jgi:hypothetical protein
MSGFGGQSSGDFRLSQGALRIVYSLIKDSIAVLTTDAFTQSNPNVQTNVNAISQVLPVNVKKGALGGSVAFTRPDFGGNFIGGAIAGYAVGTRPLGLFINDALGNAFENTPGPASGKGPFLRGGAVGVKIYETNVQSGGFGALTYLTGDRLYASVNGYLTNRWQDSYEYQWINGVSGSNPAGDLCIEPDVTCMGTVLSPPDATLLELCVELAFI